MLGMVSANKQYFKFYVNKIKPNLYRANKYFNGYKPQHRPFFSG